MIPIDLPASPAVATAGAVSRWRVHVYAHTHWDREWYRTFERFRMQLVGVVDRILHVLDSDPRFETFVLDGQTIVLEDYLHIRPEEEPRIRRLVGAGRIEVGPWHVLPDEFLVSGESLVRNLAEGRRVASRFGTPLAVGYLPDPFGHVAQLPAVLRGFGIDNVIFSRGMGDQHARTGSEFRWQAQADGVDVLALVQGSPYTSGYCNTELVGRGHGSRDALGYEAVMDLAPYLAERSTTGTMLLAQGCDHETIQEELPTIVERIAELLPDADVRITGLDEYVQSVRDAEQSRELDGRPLERWQGELRGSLHAPILASIFSARIPLKQRNDRLQVLLERHVEPLMAVAVAAGARPRRDVDPFLRHAWRLVLENHPHDSIGGCSIDDVHLEMHARSLRAEAVAMALVEDLRVATGLGNVDVVHDAQGVGGIIERTDGSVVAVAPARPGVLAPLDGIALVSRPTCDDESGRIEAAGTVARISDVEGITKLVIERAGRTTAIDWVDVADAGDEYDFGAVADDAEVHASVVEWSAAPAGPGVSELRIGYRLELPKSLEPDRTSRSSRLVTHDFMVRARVSEVSPLVELVLDFDNAALDHRLRMRASVEGLVASDTIEALGHFAHVTRPVRPVDPIGEWRQLPPGLDHCLGAVRAESVLLAGRGIHEYEADAGRLELTVLRSVGWLSRDDVVGRPGHAGPALETPGAQCIGPHRVHLAVGIADGANFDAARAFLAPPLLFEAFDIGQSSHPASTGADPFPLESGAMARARDVLRQTPSSARSRIEAFGLELGGEGVVVSACKLASDETGDLVVRWWAPIGGDGGVARLRVAAAISDIQRARLDETMLGPAPVAADGTCEVRVVPGGIATLRIRLAPSTSAR